MGRYVRGAGEDVLYLDFDGVLHHENVLWHPNVGAYLSAPDGYVLFQHAQLLENILVPYPNLKLVLSTTWVVRYGSTQAAKNLRPALRSRVIGATYNSRMNLQTFRETPRGEQVWSDVCRRKPRMWIAVDDNAEGWPAQALENLVLAHKHQGISDPDVLERLKKRLEAVAARRGLTGSGQFTLVK